MEDDLYKDISSSMKDLREEARNPERHFWFLSHGYHTDKIKFIIYLFNEFENKKAKSVSVTELMREFRRNRNSIDAFIFPFVACDFLYRKAGHKAIYYPRRKNGKLLFEKYALIAFDKYREQKKYDDEQKRLRKKWLKSQSAVSARSSAVVR